MSDSTPIPDLVQAILEVTAPITQMLDHMLRAPEQPDIKDVVKTIKRVLEDILEPLGPRDDLHAATDILNDAIPLILEGVYVDPHRNRHPSAGAGRTEHISRRQLRGGRLACCPCSRSRRRSFG